MSPQAAEHRLLGSAARVPPPAQLVSLLRDLLRICAVVASTSAQMDGSGGDLRSTIKKWHVIYPVYLNSKKTVAEGRRITASKACPDPTCIEIADCCYMNCSEIFKPLTDEEENEVHDSFQAGGPSSKVLVLHEPSNIEVSKEKFQCLKLGCWLNDEVVNLYIELLKERAKREPKTFLKCHFFNTFFYKKE